jgi:hypothetical protein
MHAWSIAISQSINRRRQLWAQTFCPDLLDRVEVGLEGKHNSFGTWKTVQSLPFAT